MVPRSGERCGLGMKGFNSGSSVWGDTANHSLSIAYLYPRWQLGRRSHSMDVLGYGLAKSMNDSDRALMLARGVGEDPSAPIQFLGGRVEQTLSKAMIKAQRVAKRAGLDTQMRRMTGRFEPLPTYGRAAGRVLAEFGVDIAHIHIYDKLVPFVAGASPETRIVLHIHDHGQRRRARREVAENLAICDRIVTCSEFMARATREHFPEFAHKIEAIPNSIPNMATQHNVARSEDILFVGRLSPEKGVHVLIEAFVAIARRHPKATLTLVGPSAVPGPIVFETHFDDPVFAEALKFVESRSTAYTAHLRNLVPDHLSERVHFHSEIPNERVGQMIKDAGVLVLPSIWQEPFGLPALEASVAGIPAVVTRSGALPEIIEDGVTGLVVSRNDVEGLADGISRILAEPDLAERMGQAAFRRAHDRFGWPQYVGSWRSLYHSIVDA